MVISGVNDRISAKMAYRATIRLLTAHRDQSSSLDPRLVSGLRSCPFVDRSDTFPGICPVVSRRNFRFATVAGAAPDSNRLPNYPFGQFTEEHLEHRDLTTDA